jgi:hypothetical protein
MFDVSKERIVGIALVALLSAGCGGGEGGGGSAGGGDEGGGDAPAPAATPVDAATAGNLMGTVAFEGAIPEMAAIDMSEEATCADKHSSPPMSEEVVVGNGDRLANVFVYVSEGLGDLTFPTPAEPVQMDQNGCVYIPHVLGVMANQDINIKNSDAVLHNINASPETNRGFNFGQPVVNMESTRSFPLAEVMIPVRCDVHGWMSSYIGVMDHPYYAVSGESGEFSLETLPPGDYTITAWHERYGVQTEVVTVATGETADVTFIFSESMAGRPVPMGEPVDMHDHGSQQVAAGGQ